MRRKESNVFERFSIYIGKTAPLKENPRLIDDKTLRIRASITLLLILGVSTAGIIYSLLFANDLNYVAYACIFGAVCILFLALDFFDTFEIFQETFETAFCGNGQTVWFGLFAVLGFVDYIMIGLADDEIIKGETVTWIINVLFWICVPLAFATWIAYWKTFSFYCSEKSWMHALFYLTIVGYIIIALCRWIRPCLSDDTTSWHRSHDLNKILKAIAGVLTLMFLFCVVLGGLCIAAFAEFVKVSQNLGIQYAIILFCILSMAIMLTPLAPGSIVDVCGGFVFVQLLSNDLDFFASWIIGIVSAILLHYCGACAQWFIGSMPCVQIWANKTLPVEMLAASDAVLRDANWFKVGLVGYIFMDTANGLNQGRINMEFWTQLFSEWPSIPNAFGLVSLGATIAAQALELSGTDWAVVAVPLFILVSTLIQTFGATFGARAMGNSVDTVDYWTSREKWTMMQFLQQDGYMATKQGWQNDVFNLVSRSAYTVALELDPESQSANDNDAASNSDSQTILFDQVDPVHKKYLKTRDSTKDAQKRIEIFENYRQQLVSIREQHYENFDSCKKACVEKGWLIHEPIQNQTVGFFELTKDENELPIWKRNLWISLIVIMTITFWASFVGIYWQSDIKIAIRQGIKVLNDVDAYAWVSFILFIVCYIFINHREIISGSKSMGKTFMFLIFGCKINQDVETGFPTPTFENSPKTIDEKQLFAVEDRKQ